MNKKIKNQKGFVRIPILIPIIIGIVIIVMGGYFGYTKLSEYKAEQIGKERQTQELFEAQEKLLEEVQKEIEGLKGQRQGLQLNQQETKNNIGELTNTEIIQKVKSTVVYVETIYGIGSGMIIEEEGYILTNAHVVRGASLIKVHLSNGESFTVTKISINEDIDLALLKINANNLSAVEFGNSDKIQQGDEVFTFGYPFGIKGDVSFKEGTISRELTKKGMKYLEISAEIHPGNSGGPLVNRFGQVVGINTAKFGESIKGVLLGESIKLAIPINTAINLIPALKLNEKFVSSFDLDCVSQKAKGFITIYSDWSSPVGLIASTRFMSSEGLIFRIDENISVPALGQVTVSVTAAEVGSKYKIRPSTFNMPGLVGTDKFTAFVGESYQSMTCNY